MRELGNPPPPEQVPNFSQGNALLSGAPRTQQNAPMGNGAQAAQQPSPPTHEQTVAALRHFDAIKGVLAPLLQDPALGKSNMKMPVIDAVTKLVADRIISTGTAVDQLSKFPSDPLLQRKTLQNMMQQAIQAERVILAHHAIGFAGQGPQPTPSADSHMDHMTALHANYSRGR
jgi:hypothetical protein